MFAVRMKQSGSWLDPECSGLLGWKLGRRLWARVQGEKGVFITLTYRRDEYADAEDLYHRQAERQDVPLFMRRLARRLRQSLKGRWICKLEFQRGGWVHFHIILLGLDFIDHAMLTEAWGQGHVWIKKLTKARVLYTCKYVAKGGNKNVPFWIYGERPRSVKIIRTSQGFWRDKVRQSSYCPIYAKYGPPPLQRVNGYTPIGVKLRQKGLEVAVGRRRFSVRCDPGPTLCRLSRFRSHSRDGWLWYHGDAGMVKRAACGRMASSAATLERAAQPAGREAAGLHLKKTSKPDADPRSWLPWWVEAQNHRDAMEEWEECPDWGGTVCVS